MRFKEFVWLLYYSFIKEPLEEFVALLAELKKAKSWLYLSLATAIWSAYYDKMSVLKIVLPVLIIIYILRNKIEGAYIKDLFEHDIAKGKDSKVVKDYYEQYKKKCFFSKTVPLEYDCWKQNEVSKRCIDTGHE